VVSVSLVWERKRKSRKKRENVLFCVSKTDRMGMGRRRRTRWRRTRRLRFPPNVWRKIAIWKSNVLWITSTLKAVRTSDQKRISSDRSPLGPSLSPPSLSFFSSLFSFFLLLFSSHFFFRKLILIHTSEEEVRQFTVSPITPHFSFSISFHFLLSSLLSLPSFFLSLLSHLPKAFANTELRCSGIYSPRVNETIILEADTQIHQIQIRNDLWDSLRFIHTSPYDIAYFRGVVTRKRKSDTLSDHKMMIDSGGKEAGKDMAVPVLTPLSSSKQEDDGEESDTSEWEPDPVTLHLLKRRKTHHTPLYIGDVGLKDLRKAAEEEEVSATLQSGVLTCGAIRVRKHADKTEERSQERWTVEGPLSDQYYTVRDLLLRRYQAV